MKKPLLILVALFGFANSAAADDNLSRVFTGRDAAQAVGRALIKEGAGDEIRVQISGVREEDQIALSAGSPIKAEVENVTLDKMRGRWEATLYMAADGKSLAPARISGTYDEMAHIPMLKQRMQSGDIIAEDDIVWDSMPMNRLRKSTIMDSKALVGKSPKRIVSPNRPIRLDEITGPTVVSKGAQVSLIYKTPNLEIKTLGEAMESGAQGTVIKVKNTSSKAILVGTVEGEGRVRVSPPDSVSAGLAQ